MKRKIITVACVLFAACSTVRAAQEEDADLTKKISEVLKEAEKVKAGMSREELMKVFTTEGGLSTAKHRTYVHKRCPLVKVDVDFTLEEKQGVLDELPGDKIAEISKPYLAWPIDD